MDNEETVVTEPVVAPATEPQAPAEDIAALKAELDKWKANARKHEERSKSTFEDNKKKDEILKSVAAQLGLEISGKPDAEVLSEKLTQAQAAARQKTIELAVYTAAASAGANASALLDSREFISRASLLDADSVDFGDRMSELVKEAAALPRFASQPAAQPANAVASNFTQPPASASGAQFGTPVGSRQWTEADVERATPDELKKAMQDGLLMDMGFGKSRNRYR